MKSSLNFLKFHNRQFYKVFISLMKWDNGLFFTAQ